LTPHARCAFLLARTTPSALPAAILMLWNVPSAFLTGCLFTTFIAWIR
jgi:hypothetical protein